MNLNLAIESGKKIRRSGTNGVYCFPSALMPFSVAEVLAEWEVEQPAKQKVTMWQAIYKNVIGTYIISTVVFENETQAKNYTGSLDFIKLINPIEIEI